MKKYILLLFACLLAVHPAYAEEDDLFSDEVLLGTEKSLNSKIENNKINAENNEENSSSFFGFIINPISKFFGSREKITEVPEGETESLLDISIRKAEEGSIEDQTNLAYMYLYGANGVASDYVKAFKYYEMAAKQNDPVALNNLGSLYFSGIGTKKDNTAALACFQKASDLGNDNASLNLAFIYLTGGTKDAVRNRKAIELFEKAKKSGNKIAEFMMGYAYYKGFVVDVDYTEAYRLVKSAAIGKSKIDEAQLVLANMYTQGLGTVQNYNSAIKAYLSAVGQGNMEAILTLAEIYADGKIVAQNLVLAHTLYNIAASQNVPGAAQKRDELNEKMQLEELTNAQAQAQNYKVSPSELTTYIRQTYGYNIRSYIDNNIPDPNTKNKK